jgi:(1->4)-alpha-D-glucan 1-alpha-D-glucosylmutase
VPSSTYRLQLHAGFGFDAAAAIVPYLASLGVSHLYLSPVLQAATGSMHGYDVTDHDRVAAGLGGEEGLAGLAEAAHRAGLGIVVDVVPNHMALVAPESELRPLWRVLRDGPDAATAQWFDVDWEHGGGRVALPLLDRPLDKTLELGELAFDDLDGSAVIRYRDHVFPVAAGTEGADVGEVLARQHYLLAGWTERDDVLNYRRFFDVDSLIAVRVEAAEVFRATHRRLLDLHGRGVVDGFRIDHPDGLADPEEYLERLRVATRGAWVVVEKILAEGERLPESWPCAGTTGYDALRVVQEALLPPTAAALAELWEETLPPGSAGRDAGLAAVLRQAKQDVLGGVLCPELRRLTRVALRAGAGESAGRPRIEAALAELLVQIDTYRAYVRLGRPVDLQASQQLSAAVARARDVRPDLAVELEALERRLLDSEADTAAGRDLVVRFQQTCGPVMAKGIEDTAFYRWHELVALNEVGSDPAALAEPSTDGLHAWAGRQTDRHPFGLTTLSTHDTKRSEDVRARLLAVAGDPSAWRTAWEPVRAAAERLGVDLPTAYLVMQTLLGAWPIDRERLGGYLVKAVREAKRHTSWTNPVEEHESRLLGLARVVTEDADVRNAVEGVLTASREAIRATILSAKLLQLTMPGVPDVYQGREVLDLSLTDPDNRRPVDFAGLRDRLRRLDDGQQAADLGDEKLLVTSRALRLRRASPELFTGGSYQPLAGAGPHLLGFVRGGRAITLVTRWPTLLSAAGGWGEATVALPAGSWTDALSGRRTTGGSCPVADLLQQLPVALLVADG